MTLVSYLSKANFAPPTLPQRVDVATPLHRPGHRPFEARQFKRREFERCDTHGFLSVKENRPVEVDGITAIAVALALECNPQVAAYTERPRGLPVGDETIELDFWVRHVSGYEEFLLLVGDGECRGVAAKVPRPREADRLLVCANAAGINLGFVTESQVRRAGVQAMVHNRLLAFSQVAQTLPHRLALRERILEHMKLLKHSRIDQLEVALVLFDAGDVQAVACELVCLGLLDVDHDAELTRHSVLTLVGVS